ncbi:MAG: radical SAM protein [Spirochaetes bacterium]|nr:radical SAM protein [Spirochaetota bacterium]
MKHLFGPVISRRLGISLGIDLLISKTCSLDCIYCECGKTKNLTTKIREYVPTEDVIIQLREFLKDRPKLDVITFAGSGEPTLHNGIGKIIKFIKTEYPEYKIAVLTNSTLFYLKKVRKSILDADIIIPSLDAASEETFKKISRPEKSIRVNKIINGLTALRKEYKNSIILEIFIITGINDNKNELDLLKNACLKISPDLIQLNTLDRPGTEKWIEPASEEKLMEIKTFFRPLKVQIIQNHNYITKRSNKGHVNIPDAVISSLSRRPSTIEDLSLSLGINLKDVKKIINALLEKGAIISEKSVTRGIFYKKRE